MLRKIIMALALTACAGQTHAVELRYMASLSGDQYPTETGSAATGTATLVVDPATQTIDAVIRIDGIRFEQLAHHLAHSAVGPMHLHRYQGDDVSLILPFPLNASYAETATGFTVTMNDVPYQDAAAIVHSELSFEQFVGALSTDPIYLNIHTNAFGDGEISGRVIQAAR
ncbi:MAG: CHRD domain-containing protein [Hyphomonadaceae bacterium]|nr:CHRD domain-containing protein [Hyphomonadaceae bacterium]